MRGDKCSINTCDRLIKVKGTMCSIHRQRFRKFNSYDLPSYIGEPSYVVLPAPLPEGIVHICAKNHGHLSLGEVYIRRFHKKKGGDGVQYHCKKCARDGNIRRNYNGMESMECYQKMWDKQNGLCYICNNPSSQKSNNSESIKSLAVDHDHITSKVRKLLCGECNSLLGYARDSIEKLEKCIYYLKEHAPT